MRKDVQKWHEALSLEAKLLDFNIVLGGTARRRQWQQPLQLLMSSRLSRLRPDIVSCNSLLGTLAKTRWEQAVDFFFLLSAKNWRPNTISRSSLAACEKVGKWTAALWLLSKPTDIVACTTGISACGQGHWQLPGALLCMAPIWELLPNVVAFTTALSVSGWTWVCSMVLIQEMSLQLDLAAFTAVVDTCGTQWKSSLDILRWGRRRGLNCDGAKSAALASCAEANSWEHCIGVLLESRPATSEMGRGNWLKTRLSGFSSSIAACDSAHRLGF